MAGGPKKAWLGRFPEQAINFELYRRFEDEGLEFAYPTQTLFLRSEDASGVGR